MTHHLPPLDEAPLLIRALAWAFFAGLGGSAKFAVATLRSTERISTRRFFFFLLLNLFISAFSGLLGALVCAVVTKEPTAQLAAAGVFGYLGPQGIDILVLSWMKKNFPSPVSSVMPIPPSVDPAADR